MDKEHVKLLLGSFRAEDADDPIFKDALRALESDPELAAWFEDLQRFDAAASAKLQEIDVPPDVKGHILLGYPKEVPVPQFRYRRQVLAGTVAALLVIGAIAWSSLVPRQRSMSSLEKQAVAYTDHMPALQFVCFNPAAVARWINEQPDSRKIGLNLPKPDESMTMTMIGASVTKWNGHPVVMVCLQDGKHMAMLYVLDANASTDLKEGLADTVQHGDWVVRTSKIKGQIHILTAKGRPEDLDFKMPFEGA